PNLPRPARPPLRPRRSPLAAKYGEAVWVKKANPPPQSAASPWGGGVSVSGRSGFFHLPPPQRFLAEGCVRFGLGLQGLQGGGRQRFEGLHSDIQALCGVFDLPDADDPSVAEDCPGVCDGAPD